MSELIQRRNQQCQSLQCIVMLFWKSLHEGTPLGSGNAASVPMMHVYQIIAPTFRLQCLHKQGKNI
ncbi:unnamed protein product [Spodoptera exigua]|nr:unnamed protein product [Spodoptera exigua]